MLWIHLGVQDRTIPHRRIIRAKKLKVVALSLLGIGCTIGTGYFLGSGIGIKLTGPSMVVSFLIAAIGTYIVFHFWPMTTADPQEGSFVIMREKRLGGGHVSEAHGITGARKF